MLSGSRLLLSALALKMYVFGLLWCICRFFSFVCVGRFLVSFVLPLSFGFVVSLSIFMPVGSAGVGGRRWWIREYPELALHWLCCRGSSLLSCSFFCYSWLLGYREASKWVVLEFT